MRTREFTVYFREIIWIPAITIVPVSNNSQNIIGITTVNTAVVSDDPDEWKYKNICNEFGDLYLRKERLAVGQKLYDQYAEMNYIETRMWEHYIPINNKYFDNFGNRLIKNTI